MHMQYLCMFVLANKVLSPSEMDTVLQCLWIAFLRSEAERLASPPCPFPAFIHLCMPSALSAFPTKPPQPELQPWGPVASLSQIESQILLGRGNREAQDEWRARLCHVSVCWWMVRAQRTASGGAAKSRVFRILCYSAVNLVLNVIF